MGELKKPLDQGALDELTLGTDEARAAYQEQRLTLEVGAHDPSLAQAGGKGHHVKKTGPREGP